VKNAVEFNQVLRDKIFPLLMEFFYNDWEGLREALGEPKEAGRLIVSLDSKDLSRARNKWAWWFDQDEATEVDPFDSMIKNYGLASEPEKPKLSEGTQADKATETV